MSKKQLIGLLEAFNDDDAVKVYGVDGEGNFELLDIEAVGSRAEDVVIYPKMDSDEDE